MGALQAVCCETLLHVKMIQLQFHKTLSFGRTEIKAGTLLAIFLHTSLLCKTFFFLSPFLFSLNISWLAITDNTDAESWQKEQKKACLEGDTGLAQQAFSLQNRLVAYIPINYTILISKITNIPRNSRRQTEMGGGGIGAICCDRLFLLEEEMRKTMRGGCKCVRPITLSWS